MQKLERRVRFGIGSLSIVAVGVAHGSGFSLLEQSASQMGTAYAGAGSSIDDVTAMYYNAASLTYLAGTELAVVGSGIDISSKFSNRNSQPAFGQPLGNSGGDAGGTSFVPAAYAAMPLNDKLAIGLGINVPFGLKLHYDEDGWIGRYQALKSEIKTINVNPTLAYQLTDTLSIGVGVDYQQVDAELTNAVNYSGIVAQGAQQAVAGGALSSTALPSLLATTQGLDGRVAVKGDDDGWGFNLGILYAPSDTTRVGLSYRSTIKYRISGTVRFIAPTIDNPIASFIAASAGAPGGPVASSSGYVDLRVPDTTMLSAAQRIGPKFELFADVALVGWSSVHEIRVRRNTGETVSVSPSHWKDAWRFALGGAYDLSPTWKLRAGVTYDQSQIPDATRTARLPDSSRTIVAIGAQWRPSEAMKVDFAYGHLFSPDASLNQDDGNAAQYGVLNGEQRSNIELLSAQLVYRF